MATSSGPWGETVPTRPELVVLAAVGWSLVAVGVLAPLFAVFGGEFPAIGGAPLQDAIHAVTGVLVLGTVYRSTVGNASKVLLGLGSLYLLLVVVGILAFAISTSILGLNAATNVFHLALGGVLVGLGITVRSTE